VKELTITHSPVRSLMVTSGGAAIVAVWCCKRWLFRGAVLSLMLRD